MGIAASIVSAVLKSVVGDKLGSGLINELVGISIDGVSEKGINEIIDFINRGKSEIDSILSRENLKSMRISEEIADYVVAEIKELLSKICITDEVLRQCKYESKKLKDFMWNEYITHKNRFDYTENESEIKECLFAVADALIELVRESENFVKDVLIYISNSVDDANVELLKISEYMDKNFNKLNADNQTILKILQMILEQNQDRSAKNKEKQQKVKSRTKEYADKWNQNMFLNDFDKRDENAGVNVKLSEVYLEDHLPHYLWGKNEIPSKDLNNLLNDFIDKKSNYRMLLILGQPGIGKSTLITWIMAKFDTRIDDILVYQFASDFKKIKWQDGNSLLKVLGLSSDDLNNKVLILDGYDEINMGDNRKEILDKIYFDLISTNHIRNFRLIITCRENYIQRYARIACKHITLQPWDEMQISSFCKIYEKKTNTVISQNTIEKALENKEILGIPLILYMVLALNITIEKEGSIVDIYDEIFSLEKGGIYDRCINEGRYATPHRISEIKKQIHQISREIAIWMFENNPDEASIPEKEYKKICIKVVQEQEQKKEDIKSDFLIGNFFRLVQHCEGVETENLYFVHRSIYEYFVIEMICSSISQLIEDFYDNGNRKELSKKIACILGQFMKRNKLSISMIEFLHHKIKNGRLNKHFDIVNDAFQLMLQEGMTYYTGERYKNVIDCEMCVFTNMLEILHLWDDDYRLEFDMLFCKYLRYNKSYGINLKRIELRMNKAKSGLLDLTKGIYLEKVCLVGADLSDADLSRADLKNSDFRKAIMPKINLELADLSGANLNGVNLSGANLKRTNLIEARLVKANLRDADLTGANLTGTFLIDADLAGVKLNNTSLKSAIISENQVDYLQKRGYDLQGAKVFIEKTGEMILYENLINDKKKL